MSQLTFANIEVSAGAVVVRRGDGGSIDVLLIEDSVDRPGELLNTADLGALLSLFVAIDESRFAFGHRLEGFEILPELRLGLGEIVSVCLHATDPDIGELLEVAVSGLGDGVIGVKLVMGDLAAPEMILRARHGPDQRARDEKHVPEQHQDQNGQSGPNHLSGQFSQ